MYYLGLDVGSSSVKIALVAIENGYCIDVVQQPSQEMEIISKKKGWAEQQPEKWWDYCCLAIKEIKEKNKIEAHHIKGIGISYQMHGLVVVDKQGHLLRNAIIWCDSRAVDIGEKAYRDLGETYCKKHFLNAPGNFTASKLRWVKEYEPDVYERIYKFMLPGDYIAFRFSNKINTTVSGLSEGILWNFKEKRIAKSLLEHYDISTKLIPDIVPVFGAQSYLSKKGASESGLATGTPIYYRAGDQPNNALALNVLAPGEIAATGGTSGVVYAVTDTPSVKESGRVNNFAHVNYQSAQPMRVGKLLCINGAGILYRWLKNNLAVGSYEEMNKLAEGIAIGAEGISMIPFGNGAERMLENKETGMHLLNVDLNRHHKAHLCRAGLEGIAFSFVYGIEILRSDGIRSGVIRAGNDNLFRSEIFAQTISTLTEQPIKIYHTTGAVGAARACVLHDGNYKKFSSFIDNNDHIKTYMPSADKTPYIDAYSTWKHELEKLLTNKT
ncbi:xylulokinase [Flavobacteriaceae bacterium M23B6Z8]